MTPKAKSKARAAQPPQLHRRLGAAGIVAGTAPFNIVRAHKGPLKVGVLLPALWRAGEASAGLPAPFEITNGILKEPACPNCRS